MKEKKSFAALVADDRVDKHNSDLQNLAHALLAVEANIEELESLKRRIITAAKTIESGRELDVAVVAELYQEANGRPKGVRR